VNNISYVEKLIEDQLNAGIDPQIVLWNAACACKGWPYVFGAVGEKCEPKKRRQYGAKFYMDDHKTIVTKCKALSWDSATNTCNITGTCSGCKWNLPVMMFDCRGYVRKMIQMVYKWTLQGAGCTAQWNTEENWKAKGSVADGIPRNTIVCLFRRNGKTMEHTGFGYNGASAECSSGVQVKDTMAGDWTDWAVPACVDAEVPDPEPVEQPYPPTLKQGSSGLYVKLAQQLLKERRYDLGSSGVDGKFGPATAKAVKAFQKDWGLKQDGIIGKKTWELLKSSPVKEKTYSVTIKGLDKTQATAICNNYPGSTMKEECP